MKRITALLLLVVILSGCQYMDDWDKPIGDLNHSEETAAAAHLDHTAIQARQRENFFVECVRNEGVTYYLSYREPDGCVTRIYTFGNNDQEPELRVQNRCFYFVELLWGTSEGTLYSVDFSGKTSKLLTDDSIRVNYIVRVDDDAVYCCANEGEIYLKVPLDLAKWETVSREEARSGK